MKLHYIYSSHSQRGILHRDILEKACQRKDVTFVSLDSQMVQLHNLPSLTDEDAVYRHGGTKRCKAIEQMLLNDSCRSFYKDWHMGIGRRGSSYFYNLKAGVPVVETFPALPVSSSEMDIMVEQLGGYPVVLKVMGNSKGVGVIKVDSKEALKSSVDYFRNTNETVFLRSFVPHAYYGRLVVVGDRVVGSHQTYVDKDEFRSNAAGNPEENKMAVTFSDDVEQAAINAVHSLGVAYGGVDVLFVSENEYYISEVNSPCGFESTERIGQCDIAGPMIDYLFSDSK